MSNLTIGVLALQGGFAEHLASLRKAAAAAGNHGPAFTFVEVRTSEQLTACDALVIPGGESTTLSLVAARSGLLEPLREFVKISKKPTWGTCAGLIMLSEAASATKRGGQELIGGLDVKVHRNHFGRQRESFVTDLPLPFLGSSSGSSPGVFPAVFIRAPVVERVLQQGDRGADGTAVEVLATLPGRHASNEAAAKGESDQGAVAPAGDGDIVALRQSNVFGTSFHPELTNDIRIHVWWLREVMKSYSE